MTIKLHLRHIKIRAIIRKAIREMIFFSKNVFDLENLCTIMEERMVKNVYNDSFNNIKSRRWIMDR